MTREPLGKEATVEIAYFIALLVKLWNWVLLFAYIIIPVLVFVGSFVWYMIRGVPEQAETQDQP